MSQPVPAPTPTTSRRQARLPLLGSLFFLSLFALLTVGVRQRSRFVEWDAAFKEALHAHAHASPATAAVFASITELASERAAWIEAAALLLILAVARQWWWSAIWILAFSGNQLVKVLKVLIDRDRPMFADPIVVEATRSFPSGHAAAATIFFGMAAYFIAKTRPKLRLGMIVLAGWMILFVGFSRIYLGAHWLSDVLGGVTFGLGWILLWIAAAEAIAPLASLPK